MRGGVGVWGSFFGGGGEKCVGEEGQLFGVVTSRHLVNSAERGRRDNLGTSHTRPLYFKIVQWRP